MITVQHGEHIEPTACSCCGHPIELSYGFMYRDGDAYAIYQAAWSYAHVEDGADVAIEVSERWDANDTKTRVSFGLRIYVQEEDIGLTLVDPADSAWSGRDNAGRMLQRAEALRHPLKADVLDLAEEIIDKDPKIRRFLEERPKEH